MQTNEWQANNKQEKNLTDVERKWWKFESPASVALTALSVTILAGGAWYFFITGEQDAAHTEIPIIMAEAGPNKIRPENAGKTNVPHQDKLVYNRLNPSEKPINETETLLPPPEEPIQTVAVEQTTTPVVASDDSAAAGTVEKKSAEPTTEPITIAKRSPLPPIEKAERVIAAESNEKESKVLELAESSAAPSDSDSSSNAVHIPRSNAVPQWVRNKIAAQAEARVRGNKEGSTIKVADATANKQPITKVGTMLSQSVETGDIGNFRVQVASLPSPTQAESEWKRIKSAYKKHFKDQDAHFVRVDLGAKKGIYYRIQVGNFTDRSQARQFCKELKQDGARIGCLIVPTK